MTRTDSARSRLELSLLKLSRASAARANASSRRGQTQPQPQQHPRPSSAAAPPAPAPPLHEAEPAREPDVPDTRVSELASSIMERFDALEKRLAATEPAPAVEEPPQATGPSISEMAADLIERLDRIEERLADLTRPLRPIPASREIFGEWVRLRKWEEMAFGDFLRLRRSGVV